MPRFARPGYNSNDMKLILIITITILSTGCSGILKSAYGIKDPVTLSNTEIANQAAKLKIPAESSFRLSSSYFNLLKGRDSLKPGSEVCSPMITKYQQPLQALYFNKNGSLVSMHTNCYAGGFPLLKWNNQGQFSSFVPRSTVPITDSVVTLKTIWPYILPVNNASRLQAAETTVVVFWTGFMAKQSRELIKVVNKNVALSKGSVAVLYVNVDNSFTSSELNNPKLATMPTF